MTYFSLSTEPEAWLSQLSYAPSTGIKNSQYLPQINTSVEVELIDVLPSQCNPKDTFLLINYAGSSTLLYASSSTPAVSSIPASDWSIKVYIPNDSVTAPFNDTDDAQTWVETAYLDLLPLKPVTEVITTAQK